jgi:DNA-binding IclR family transcriptional regulator
MSKPPPPNLKSAEKVCAILRALSANPGSRLMEVSYVAGLNKVTASRILAILCQEGFAKHERRRYWLGNEALAMAASVARSTDLRAVVRPSLLRLVRSGTESVCIDRELGSYPIRNDFLQIGSRRPLGVGAGSMALLAFLDDEEIRSILDINEYRLGAYPRLSREVLQREVMATRERGYAFFADMVIDKTGAIGVPVFGPSGLVICAISVAALSDRVREREQFIAERLAREAQLLGLEVS